MTGCVAYQVNPKLLGPVYTDLHHDLRKGCPGKLDRTRFG